MEVHAHTHTARKKWTHYFWEFLMLFLAVFCGFLAEYKLEHIIENNRAKEYAEMLKDDLKKDTAQLNGLIKGKKQVLIGQEIADRVHKIPIDKVTWTDTDSMSKPGLDVTPFMWNDATYSQMKSSGNLRLFKDKELVRMLALYESTVKMFSWWENLKQQMLQSDYNFRSELNEDKFLKANPRFDKNKPLKEQGYDFSVWAEANLIGEKLYYYEINLREMYPELKKNADEIINLLNKKYQLR